MNVSSSVATAIADVFRKNAISVGYKFTKMLKIFDKIDQMKNQRVLNDPSVFHFIYLVKYFQHFHKFISHANCIFSKNIGYSCGNTNCLVVFLHAELSSCQK